ncbi:hypothetical protein [Sphingomonas montanisoli]|uniref:hypothetical protein n=1 Tax=Sphingomonas montanisoli TaxID=2606412 RepID=UPI0015E170ED|nr:hypothetical protein [Sphingomonas montanisoli]
MPELVIFFREGCFYPVALSGTKPASEEIPEHVALNPGTLRVEDLSGNILWPEGTRQ